MNYLVNKNSYWQYLPFWIESRPIKFAEKGSKVEAVSLAKVMRFEMMFEYASRSHNSSWLRLEGSWRSNILRNLMPTSSRELNNVIDFLGVERPMHLSSCCLENLTNCLAQQSVTIYLGGRGSCGRAGFPALAGGWSSSV